VKPETAKRIVAENQQRRKLHKYKVGGLKGRKWQGGAATSMPRAGWVKITDKEGNVRYEPPLRYTQRRDRSAHGRFRVTHEMKQRIYERDKVCQQCGAAKGPFHVDHIRPYSKGGWNVEGNLQLLCAPCNLRKGATWSKRSSG
jgi:5-methylcytosine-specific restriction endonuclease McrA